MEIKSIAVIGAGPLGRELARRAARGGFSTLLEDVNSETLERALLAIRSRIGEVIHAGRPAAEDCGAALERLTTSRSIEEAMRSAEFIIDTTIDELETKLEVFTIFDKFARPGAILASCTSSLPIADIATITFREDCCVGLKFIEDGANLKQVCIMRSDRTAEEVMSACAGTLYSMGLPVAVSRDVPISKPEVEAQ
jgi:3-hydroxyacyl-CoA dehydrogenase